MASAFKFMRRILLVSTVVSLITLVDAPSQGADLNKIVGDWWHIDFPDDDTSDEIRKVLGYQSFPAPLHPPHNTLWKFRMASALAAARYFCRAKKVPEEYRDLARSVALRRLRQWVLDVDTSKRPPFLQKFSDKAVKSYLDHWLGTQAGIEAIAKMSTYLEDDKRCRFSKRINEEIDDIGSGSFARYWEEFRKYDEEYLWNKYENKP